MKKDSHTHIKYLCLKLQIKDIIHLQLKEMASKITYACFSK